MSQNPSYRDHKIGEWTYGHPLVWTWDGHGGSLEIGKYCSIAEEVVFLAGGEHRANWVTTYPFAELVAGAEKQPRVGYSKGHIQIGNDVWIGRAAIILSGVTIGNGAIVGAGSIVTKDVAPYSVVAGNPARLIRHRVPLRLVPALEAIRWWDWPHEKVMTALPLLLSEDIEGFVQTFGSDG